MTNYPTISAFFQPQAWVRDNAMDVGGAQHFDATIQVLDLAVIHGWDWVRENVTDNSYESDNLWLDSPDQAQSGHNGPFYVNVEDAIADYLDAFIDANGRDMTVEDAQARLDAYRAAKATQPSTPAGADQSGSYRVCVTFDATSQADADALALVLAEALGSKTTFPATYRLGAPTKVS